MFTISKQGVFSQGAMYVPSPYGQWKDGHVKGQGPLFAPWRNKCQAVTAVLLRRDAKARYYEPGRYVRVLGPPQRGWRTVPEDAGANCPASSSQCSS